MQCCSVIIPRAKVWIIVASARFCPDATLVSLPTWLLAAKSRSARQIARRRRRSRQGLHLHVGMSAYHAQRGHTLGGTHWVPAVGGMGASCPLACLSFFSHLNISSSTAPAELQSELGGQTSSFQEVSAVPSRYPPSTLTRTSETR